MTEDLREQQNVLSRYAEIVLAEDAGIHDAGLTWPSHNILLISVADDQLPGAKGCLEIIRARAAKYHQCRVEINEPGADLGTESVR